MKRLAEFDEGNGKCPMFLEEAMGDDEGDVMGIYEMEDKADKWMSGKNGCRSLVLISIHKSFHYDGLCRQDNKLGN